MELYGKILSVPLLILSAYLLKKAGLFREGDSRVFVNYVIHFALPATILSTLTGIKVSRELLLVVISAWIVVAFSLGASFLVGKFLSLKGKALRTFLIVSSFGNTAFLGYPFAHAVGGEEALRYAIVYDQLGSLPLVLTVGFYLASGSTSAGQILRFPPFWALVIALFLPSPLPYPLLGFLLTVKGSLVPVILFSVGLKLNLSRIETGRRLLLALFVKQVLSPLFALLLVQLFSLEGMAARVVVLESAMPTMVFAGVLAIRYGLDLSLTVSSITLGIGLSLITVPVFLFFSP